MSVSLTSKNGKAEFDLTNGAWLHITSLCASFDTMVQPWNQTHDPKEYTPVVLDSMADTLVLISKQLRKLSKNGGANLS